MPQNNAHGYEFGPYRLDLAQRVLTRAGENVSLTPKATDILTLLVSSAGQLVAKDELLKQVWPDTFVEESNLTQNIFLLRRILGDDRPAPKYIETVVRRGYRFIANVRSTGAVEASSDPNSKNGNHVPSPSVAVLPFINATGNHDLEYLAEGLTENIVNNLSCVSKLRVMSRSAVFRYKKKELDPRVIGKELDVYAVLVGKITLRPSKSTGISVELVEVASGWQLWGHSFDCAQQDILEIQDAITRQLLSALKLKLSGDEEKRVTARYTENADAYQSYLEARYHWSHYTREGIEKAILHFRHAIELDPNYALAYAGIIDCYLRLTTNYLPPEEDVDNNRIQTGRPSKKRANKQRGTAKSKKANNQIDDTDPKIKLRFEWDCKGAERELRRANELKSEYPSAHQWNAAYRLAAQLFEQSLSVDAEPEKLKSAQALLFRAPLSTQIESLDLTPNEQVQIHCTIAREQIDAGNYEAACLILNEWWQFDSWPKLGGLNQHRCADLLFTVGQLAGWLASTRQLPNGQKHGAELLSGSIAFCEQLGLTRRASEGRIELALCYYRQGAFDHSRSTLLNVLKSVSREDAELRALALLRLSGIERDAGRLNDSLWCLNEATEVGSRSGPWVTGRCRIELASTYKELAISEENPSHFDEAKEHYRVALYEFEAVGNHRLAASTDNNLGFMMLCAGELKQAESHLLRARRAFDWFGDQIRRAQVDDSLAHLYLAQGKMDEAHEAINRAVEVTEKGDEDRLLVEALTTKGLICCKRGRFGDARRILEDAHRLASRCGDGEGAGRALLVLIEEMGEGVKEEERQRIGDRLVGLLSSSERPILRQRLQKCLEKMGYTKSS